MKTSDGSFHSCYNAQHLVNEHSQVILTWMLRNSGADCPTLPDMLTRLNAALAAAGIGHLPTTFLPDTGYFSADNVDAVTEAGMVPLIAAGRLRHDEKPPPVPRGRIPKNLIPSSG